MLYRQIASSISPTNQDRAPHVRRISTAYDASAIRRNDASIHSAGYDVAFYRQLVSGLKCTCHNDPRVFDADGNLDANIIEQLTSDLDLTDENTPVDRGNDRIIQVVEYDRSGIDEGEPYIESKDQFIDYVKSGRLEPDYTPTSQTEEADIEHIEDEDDPDSDIDDNENYGVRALSSFSSNCPVCGRTGIVGGHTLAGGYRVVIDSQQFQSLHLCYVDHSQSPHRIVSGIDTSDSISSDRASYASVTTPPIILPAHLHQIQSLQAFSGYMPIYNKDDYDESVEIEIYIVSGQSHTLLRKKRDLLPFCNGRAYTFEIRFRGCSMTHFEIQMRMRREPTRFDISNYSRVFSTKHFNDVDPLQVTIPSHVGNVSRGDLFYDRRAGILWILTSVESLRTADSNIGFSGTASRVRTKFEPYALYNPYLGNKNYTGFFAS